MSNRAIVHSTRSGALRASLPLALALVLGLAAWVFGSLSTSSAGDSAANPEGGAQATSPGPGPASASSLHPRRSPAAGAEPTGGAAPERVAEPEPIELGLLACLDPRAAEDELQACAYNWFLAAREEGPELAARMLCSGNLEKAYAPSVVAAMLRAWSTRSPLTAIDRFREACAHFRTDELLAHVVLGLQASDPELYTLVRADLTPDRVFDPEAGGAAVRLAREMAKAARDQDLVAILEEGAKGNLGGTATQVDYAILSLGRVGLSGKRVHELANEILATTNYPEGAYRKGVGSSVAVLLMSPSTGFEVSSGELTDALARLLDDPTLGASAALQVARYRGRDEPPSGLDSTDWAQVWDHATAILADKGLE